MKTRPEQKAQIPSHLSEYPQGLFAHYNENNLSL